VQSGMRAAWPVFTDYLLLVLAGAREDRPPEAFPRAAVAEASVRVACFAVTC
jgi:hypothetical protein